MTMVEQPVIIINIPACTRKLASCLLNFTAVAPNL